MSADLPPEEITRRLKPLGFAEEPSTDLAPDGRRSWRCVQPDRDGYFRLYPWGVIGISGPPETVSRIVSALGLGYSEEQVREVVAQRLWARLGFFDGLDKRLTEEIMAALRGEGG